jgi:hypothetical protein
MQRGRGNLSAKERGRGIPPRTVNKKLGLAREGGSCGMCPATRSRKACESGGRRKTPQKRGKTTSHVSCKQTHRPEKAGAVSLPPVCLEREKLVAEARAQENSG